MAFAMDGQKHFIEIPLVSRSGPAATQLIGIVLPEFATPLANGFVGDGDATFEQQLLHVAVAQGESIVEPDLVTDDFPGKAVILVALGVGRRGHVWLPILGFNGSWRGYHRGHDVMRQEG
jgi:hypothetical protein